jgi:uncharacterized repeat protein (TIGR03803 family)
MMASLPDAVPEGLSMRIKQMALCSCFLATAVVALFTSSAFAAKPGYKILYNFLGFSDGTSPFSSVIADAPGNLYGTTPGGGGVGGGAVYELSPPPTQGGAWTETLIYRFQGGSDGAQPYASLIFDKAGNLYGTTLYGGTNGQGFGTVFELTPPVVAGDPWTETVLHRFRGTVDGQYPYAPLVFDAAGNLFGTTLQGGSARQGTVFELSPPTVAGGTWTEKIIHTFIQNNKDGFYPYNGLTRGSNGVLYGTTSAGGQSDNGTVFRLTPPSGSGGAWTESVLYSFTGGADGFIPRSGLIFDQAGNLFGSTVYGGVVTTNCTHGCGVIFELSPPAVKGGAWTESVLHSFLGGDQVGNADGAWPYDNLVFDPAGNLYGSTSVGGLEESLGFGTIFQLKPPAIQGEAWTESQIYSFGTNVPNGAVPMAGLRFSKGLLYGTASTGGSNGQGLVFSVAP